MPRPNQYLCRISAPTAGCSQLNFSTLDYSGHIHTHTQTPPSAAVSAFFAPLNKHTHTNSKHEHPGMNVSVFPKLSRNGGSSGQRAARRAHTPKLRQQLNYKSSIYTNQFHKSLTLCARTLALAGARRRTRAQTVWRLPAAATPAALVAPSARRAEACAPGRARPFCSCAREKSNTKLEIIKKLNYDV